MEFCHISPYFTLNNGLTADISELMERFKDVTAQESGCVYYGWNLTEDKTKLFCREAYKNGESVITHLNNVGGLLEELFALDVSLDHLYIHGPKDELEKVKPVVKDMNVTLFYNA